MQLILSNRQMTFKIIFGMGSSDLLLSNRDNIQIFSSKKDDGKSTCKSSVWLYTFLFCYLSANSKSLVSQFSLLPPKTVLDEAEDETEKIRIQNIAMLVIQNYLVKLIHGLLQIYFYGAIFHFINNFLQVCKFQYLNKRLIATILQKAKSKANLDEICEYKDTYEVENWSKNSCMKLPNMKENVSLENPAVNIIIRNRLISHSTSKILNNNFFNFLYGQCIQLSEDCLCEKIDRPLCQTEEPHKYLLITDSKLNGGQEDEQNFYGKPSECLGEEQQSENRSSKDLNIKSDRELQEKSCNRSDERSSKAPNELFGNGANERSNDRPNNGSNEDSDSESNEEPDSNGESDGDLDEESDGELNGESDGEFSEESDGESDVDANEFTDELKDGLDDKNKPLERKPTKKSCRKLKKTIKTQNEKNLSDELNQDLNINGNTSEKLYLNSNYIDEPKSQQSHLSNKESSEIYKLLRNPENSYSHMNEKLGVFDDQILNENASDSKGILNFSQNPIVSNILAGTSENDEDQSQNNLVAQKTVYKLMNLSDKQSFSDNRDPLCQKDRTNYLRRNSYADDNKENSCHRYIITNDPINPNSNNYEKESNNVVYNCESKLELTENKAESLRKAALNQLEEDLTNFKKLNNLYSSSETYDPFADYSKRKKDLCSGDKIFENQEKFSISESQNYNLMNDQSATEYSNYSKECDKDLTQEAHLNQQQAQNLFQHRFFHDKNNQKMPHKKQSFQNQNAYPRNLDESQQIGQNTDQNQHMEQKNQMNDSSKLNDNQMSDNTKNKLMSKENSQHLFNFCQPPHFSGSHQSPDIYRQINGSQQPNYPKLPNSRNVTDTPDKYSHASVFYQSNGPALYDKSENNRQLESNQALDNFEMLTKNQLENLQPQSNKFLVENNLKFSGDQFYPFKRLYQNQQYQNQKQMSQMKVAHQLHFNENPPFFQQSDFNNPNCQSVNNQNDLCAYANKEDCKLLSNPGLHLKYDNELENVSHPSSQQRIDQNLHENSKNAVDSSDRNYKLEMSHHKMSHQPEQYEQLNQARVQKSLDDDNLKNAKSNSRLQSQDLRIRAIISGLKAGSIIGRQGIVINTLRETYNCRVILSSQSNTSPDQILSINGKFFNVVELLQQVCYLLSINPSSEQRNNQFLSEQPLNARTEDSSKNKLHFILAVPSSICGCLIGRKASKIKEFQKRFNVSFTVSPSVVPNSLDRPVTISGHYKNVSECLKEVCKYLINTEKSAASGVGNSGIPSRKAENVATVKYSDLLHQQKNKASENPKSISCLRSPFIKEGDKSRTCTSNNTIPYSLYETNVLMIAKKNQTVNIPEYTQTEPKTSADTPFKQSDSHINLNSYSSFHNQLKANQQSKIHPLSNTNQNFLNHHQFLHRFPVKNQQMPVIQPFKFHNSAGVDDKKSDLSNKESLPTSWNSVDYKYINNPPKDSSFDMHNLEYNGVRSKIGKQKSRQQNFNQVSDDNEAFLGNFIKECSFFLKTGDTEVHLSVPNDIVGCIIGRGGKTISEIRDSSGAFISITDGLFPPEKPSNAVSVITPVGYTPQRTSGVQGSKRDRVIIIRGNDKAVQVARYLMGSSILSAQRHSMPPTNTENLNNL